MTTEAARGYLRHPTIAGETVIFVTEDDLWTVPAGGGDARRLTADLLEVARPVLNPDGTRVAFTSKAQGQPEVFVMPASGGPAERLTWLGEKVAVVAWTGDDRVVYTSATGQPFSTLTLAYAHGDAGAERLPFGPVGDVAFGPNGAVVVGRNTADPARWKRYRGGTAGVLWIDPDGGGDFRPLMAPGTDAGNMASPMWVDGRVWFLSDHEGVGNLYSCDPDGDGLTRHTDHGEHYARWAATDGRRVVYQVAGRLWIHDPATDTSAPVDVRLGSPRTQHQERFVEPAHHLDGFALDHTGEHLALELRGKPFTLACSEGPVRQLGQAQGVRYRLVRYLGSGAGVVCVGDEGGEEAIEVHTTVDGRPSRRRLEVTDLGRVLQLVPSPDGARLAVTTHHNRLLIIDVADGTSKVADTSEAGRLADPAWSPDGRWVAYVRPQAERVAGIRLLDVTDGTTHQVTEPRWTDSCPSFDPAGRWLVFVSNRTFDPVYDRTGFDLGFPKGGGLYLVPLAAGTPSPFLVRPKAAPPGDGEDRTSLAEPAMADPAKAGGAPGAGDQQTAGKEGVAAVPMPIDLDGIAARVLAVPVPEAIIEEAVAAEDKLLYLTRPMTGALDHDLFGGTPADGCLEVYDLVKGSHDVVVEGVGDLAVSGDRRKMVWSTEGEHGGRRLRVLAAAAKPEADDDDGWVDLDRARVRVLPGAEWVQMVREAWRLQRQQFWVADLSGVDAEAVLARYLPLVDLVATRAEISDLIWEMQGELGTSHAYEIGGDYRPAPEWVLGHLGADLGRDPITGTWQVAEVVTGHSWDLKEASPLATPGAGLGPGTALLAVDGQDVPAVGPGPLLVQRAGQPVQLTIAGPGDGPVRTVVVQPLADERPLRYRAWVEHNRGLVHGATDGRVGYLHIPDMGAAGYAEFHRALGTELPRPGLVVDARFNAGGHVSPLLLEKLRRRRIGWDVSRWTAPVPYPEESPGGPMVLLTNEWAGSDGDIFTHSFKLFGLGPVVGTRTWGGVIGIDPSQLLVDGSVTTQPEFAFWFTDVGWGVENHGTDPDHEVVITPQDHAAGRDPQMALALELVRSALADHKPDRPDLAERPSRALPVLPPRR
jgi:tricorn protease